MADKLKRGSTVGGYTIVHEGNVGAYAGAASAATDTLLNHGDNQYAGSLISTSRDQGLFGLYDSYKTDQIWSMGTAYKNSSTGADFGNLYGLAYKHTNNATGGSMAGGHQMVWCSSGTPKSAVGDNLWTSSSVLATKSAVTKSFQCSQVASITNTIDTSVTTQVIDFSGSANFAVTGTPIAGQFGFIQFTNFTNLDSWDSKISWSQNPDNGVFGSDGDSMFAVFMVTSPTSIKIMKFID